MSHPAGHGPDGLHLLRPAQLLLEQLPLLIVADLFGDVLVGAEDAHNPALAIVEWNLVRVEKGLLAVRLALLLDDVKLGPVVGHDTLVALPKKGRLLGFPGEVEVGLSDDLFGALYPGVPGELLVAAQVASIPVLPENGVGKAVDDQAEHSARLPQGFHGPAAFVDLPSKPVVDTGQLVRALLVAIGQGLKDLSHGHGAQQNPLDHHDHVVVHAGRLPVHGQVRHPFQRSGPFHNQGGRIHDPGDGFFVVQGDPEALAQDPIHAEAHHEAEGPAVLHDHHGLQGLVVADPLLDLPNLGVRRSGHGELADGGHGRALVALLGSGAGLLNGHHHGICWHGIPRWIEGGSFSSSIDPLNKKPIRLDDCLRGAKKR